MKKYPYPGKQGLYHPAFEHDACGIGFVADIRGRKSHTIIRQALTVLKKMSHRGGCGCETNTGDGAGILMQIPHSFLAKVCAPLGILLPEPSEYGAGMLFLPEDTKAADECIRRMEDIIVREGQTVLGWRKVDTDDSSLGNTAKKCKPKVWQLFIGRSPQISAGQDFERKLFIIRKKAEREIREGAEGCSSFYISSLSSRTLVYKGMLMAEQVEAFYPDLLDPEIETAIALVHSRFSTNTFPSWERAHPNRYIIHNGEINTIRGNTNWMHARQALLKSEQFGEDISDIFPVVDENGSDSAIFDNCLELLVMAGRSLPHAVMMMIPEPWSHHESMDPELKAFYEFHSCLMEPWDGPAAMAFTDGLQVGAVLDRNGLRPSRYYVTKDDLVVLASEVGVLDIPPERILKKGRLQPGRMLLVDTQQGRIIGDREIKQQMASAHPYGQWLKHNLVSLEEVPAPVQVPGTDHDTLLKRQQAFGYTYEELRMLLAPMATEAIDPIGSMGVDTPLAVLSNKPQLLFNYFKQLFAQV
ncbi:MAG TPA: glutamate synthase subunit alpha, partial [Clostridiales bacterium]|nr:glutamate synthase subunit alpha [Clostridiales bacterium]